MCIGSPARGRDCRCAGVPYHVLTGRHYICTTVLVSTADTVDIDTTGDVMYADAVLIRYDDSDSAKMESALHTGAFHVARTERARVLQWICFFLILHAIRARKRF